MNIVERRRNHPCRACKIDFAHLSGWFLVLWGNEYYATGKERKMSSEPISTKEITVTESALQQIRKIKEESNIPQDYSLRVSVKGGGCSGFTYNLGFDGETTDSDTIIQYEDVKIAVDGKSLFYLTGTELDYTDGLNGKGFVFSNPNASKTCGCGESFAV